jgi:hypothetical protein
MGNHKISQIKKKKVNAWMSGPILLHCKFLKIDFVQKLLVYITIDILSNRHMWSFYQLINDFKLSGRAFVL